MSHASGGLDTDKSYYSEYSSKITEKEDNSQIVVVLHTMELQLDTSRYDT